MKALVLFAALSAMLGPTPAFAATDIFTDVFTQCDGDLAPLEMKPEKAAKAAYLGVAGAADRPDKRSIGAAGVKACDSALSDPRLRETYWLRRSQLLQAKAYHLLAEGRPADALDMLSRSDAAIPAGQSRVLFADSLGLGNQALRGLALHRLGRAEEGARLLETIDRVRPYAPSVARLTHLIRLLVTSQGERRMALVHDASMFQPHYFMSLFFLSMSGADFGAAEDYGRQVSFEQPRDHGRWVLVGGADERTELIKRRARFDGAMAYVLIARAKVDESRARIARARADLAEARAPLLDPKASKEEQREHDWVVRAADEASIDLDLWERAIRLRETLKGKSMVAGAPLLGEAKVDDLPIFLDLARQIVPADDAERANMKQVVAQLEKQHAEIRDSLLVPELREIVSQLPRVEFADVRPKLRREENFWGNGNNGFKVSAGDGDVVDVRFGSERASRAMVEEAAMLVAANQVRRQGKDSFVLLSSQSLERTTNFQGYGGQVTEIPSGYEMRLKLRLVDSANLPPDLAMARWRLVPAVDVVTRLQASFPSEAAR